MGRFQSNVSFCFGAENLMGDVVCEIKVLQCSKRKNKQLNRTMSIILMNGNTNDKVRKMG